LKKKRKRRKIAQLKFKSSAILRLFSQNFEIRLFSDKMNKPQKLSGKIFMVIIKNTMTDITDNDSVKPENGGLCVNTLDL
jgi:hypothetical protein